jgi:predicted glutamine amidotransferase
MCRLLGYAATRPTSLLELLGPVDLARFAAMSDQHADGWGMAWPADDGPLIEKSLHRARDDDRFHRLAATPLADIGLVHLRWATPGLPIELNNSHPFRHDRYTMAHNGAIFPQDRLDELLPEPWASKLTGTTDSERYFLHVVMCLESDGDDVVRALAQTIARIEREFQPSSLNAVILTPDRLAAVSSYDRDSIPRSEMLALGYAGPPEDLDGYFDLHYRRGEDAVVVASSGVSGTDWQVLPNRHVLVVDRHTLNVVVEPIR